ncbi:hypothetical protein [Calothrix sp. CCY 0018]|uniref:hypothetical protein n=1 Tax=Calothrix sp. CCY 0018 TaxID=3103864 RepID=UPI0039C717D7
MVVNNRFTIMQKPETLAQLICRTVLEFEQRQATDLKQEKLVQTALNSPTIKASSQNISKKSKSLRLNFKNKTA